MVERQEQQPAVMTRRDFLKLCGMAGAGLFLDALEPIQAITQVLEKLRIRNTINALWDGRLDPTWLEIEGIAAGQIQVINWDPQTQDWEPEFMPTFAWIHRLPENPYAFRGLLFIHRENLERALQGREIPEGTEISIYANWNHDKPALKARIGVRGVYPAWRIDDSDDYLVREVARSSRTLAIVTCHPPGCEGNSCDRRLVYYAWAYLPK